MIGQARRTRGFWLVAALVPALSLLGCDGGAAGSGGGGTTESPAGPAIGASPSASAPIALPPSPGVSESDLAAAKGVVERLIAAVDDDDFTVARALMVDPDSWWSLDDMKAVRSIRLERVTLTRVEGSNAVLLRTDLRRDPPPMAGGPEWPNFMLLVRGASGTWRVAQTATGP